MSHGDILFLFLVFFAAFIPSFIALIWLRSLIQGRRERWEDLLLTFAFGSAVSAIAALLIELTASYLLFESIGREYELFVLNPSIISFIMIILIAPVVEEYVKALGVSYYSRSIWRPRNGLMTGAAVGLGFAATENFLYESNAYLAEGAEAFIVLALVRSFSSTLMHASATSIAGYGFARAKIYGSRWWPYLIIAMLMHILFNFFASFGELFSEVYGEVMESMGLIFSILLVVIALLFIRSRLRGHYA